MVSLVTETGYRKPLTQITPADKEELCQVLKDYYVLIKILPEINQFGDGLNVLGMLEMMRKHPQLLKVYFTNFEKEINKGEYHTCIHMCIYALV